jgi:hypothetical protein
MAVIGAVGLLVPLAGGGAQAATTAATPIHPGVQTLTEGAQCTANFVFTDGTRTYLGQAAHCSGTGTATETDGCTSQSLPIGTPVTVLGDDGNEYVGTMAYNSWLTMQANHESDANTCAYNDLALVDVSAFAGKVSPTIPFWGGPVGVNTTGTHAGDKVYSYGNSELRGGVTELSPKEGTSLGTDSGGWNHTVYTATPGVPGDSGSAFLDAQGRALGVLSTVQLAPLAGANGVGDLNHELGYAKAHFSSSLALSTGGPFSGGTSVLGLIKLPL